MEQDNEEITWLRAFLRALGMLLAMAAAIGAVAGGAIFAINRFGPAGLLGIVIIVFAAVFLVVMTLVIKFDMAAGHLFRAPPPPPPWPNPRRAPGQEED